MILCLSYDFKVTIKDKDIRLEVKALQNYKSPFHITINEIEHAIKYSESYYICFVILPSIEKGVQDIKFLRNPVEMLGITVKERRYSGIGDKCTIMPEKFLIKPVIGTIESLPDDIQL